MQPSALLKTQVALATISRLLALIAAPRDSGAITVLGTQGFNQPDGRRAEKVQKFKDCTTEDSRLSRPSPLNREMQGSKQSVNGQSDTWDASTR